MTHRRLRFALCALLVSAPLTTLAADNHGMFSAGSFYASLNWDVAFSAQRELAGPIPDGGKTEVFIADVETGFGFLGAQIGVGYAISGFRPEVYGAYRRTPITGVKFKKIGESTDEALLERGNTPLKDLDWANSAVSSLDLGLGVHYDIDTGTPLLPYLGIAGGASNITLTVADQPREAANAAGRNVGLSFQKSESAWAFGFQGDAGIGYAVTDDVVITLGYRLTGTTDVELPTSKTKLKLALIHNGELGLRYVF